MFDHEVAARTTNGRRLRLALRVLEGRGDDHAFQALVDSPRLFRLAAGQWGRYLIRLRRDGKCNQDWLLEAACGETTKGSACLQLHALRALGAAGHVAKDSGDRLGSLATEPARQWVPVKVAAADAWARSNGWKAVTACEAALGVGDVAQQRALVLSLRHGDDNRHRRRLLRRLHTVQPCRPAVAWVGAGCPAAA